MPAVSMDDGGWGSIASNFANAIAPDPKNRAQMMLAGAHYKKTLQEIEEERRKMEALQAAVTNYPSTIPTDAPMPPINGMPQEGPPSPQQQSTYSTNRNQRIADNAATSYLAKSAEDYTKGVYGGRALGEVSGGIPSDPRRQDVLQTLMSPSGGSLPNYSTTPHTFQATDATGNATGAPITSRRIPDGPSTLLEPGKLGAKNPFENSASSDQRLLALSQKAQRDPNSMTIPELEEAAVHLQNRHGVKISQGQGPDGAKTLNVLRENPYPEVYNPLVAKVAELNWYRGEKEAAAREGRPMQPMPAFIPPAATAPPDARTGGLAGGAPAVPATTGGGAPTAAPVVPPTVSGLPVGSNTAAPVQIAAGDATPLRKEFTDQIAVKNYYQAITPYKQFVSNIQVGTPQADVSMIYNLAKMLDPQSVVRDGEMLIWKKTGGPFDQLQGLYDNITQSKAALTPRVRANLADMGERVMKEFHGGFKEAADHYSEIAQSYGIAPEKVVPKVADLPLIDRKTISTVKPEPPGTPRAARSAPAAPVAPRARTIRVNPTTGAIEEVP